MGFKEFFNDHRKEILTAAGVVATGALAFLVFGKKEAHVGQHKPHQPEERTSIEIPKTESDIHVKYIEGKNILTRDTLLAIHSLIAKHLSTRYLKKTIESRQDRRKYLKAIQSYIKQCAKLQEALEQIITQVTSKILLELKIDPDAYQKAYEYHTKAEGSDAFLDKVALPDPDNVPSQIQLTKQKILEVYNYQINVLEEVVSEVVAATGSEASNSDIDHYVEFRLYDLTAYNLGIEEEDLLNKYNIHFQEDPDIKGVTQKKETMKRNLIVRFA